MGPVPTMALSQMLWAVGGGVGSAMTLSQPPALSPPQAAGSPRPLPVALLRFPEALLPLRHLSGLLPSVRGVFQVLLGLEGTSGARGPLWPCPWLAL